MKAFSHELAKASGAWPQYHCNSKHRHPTREAALDFHNRYKRGGWRVVPYHYQICDGWHLTKHVFGPEVR